MLKSLPRYTLRTLSLFTTSSGNPETITLPSCKMYALSTILSVSLTLWSVMRTPILLLFNSETRLRTSFTEIGSTPAKGSSSSIYFGSVARARAISTLRRSHQIKQVLEFFSNVQFENLIIVFPILLVALTLKELKYQVLILCYLPHSNL